MAPEVCGNVSHVPLVPHAAAGASQLDLASAILPQSKTTQQATSSNGSGNWLSVLLH